MIRPSGMLALLSRYVVEQYGHLRLQAPVGATCVETTVAPSPHATFSAPNLSRRAFGSVARSFGTARGIARSQPRAISRFSSPGLHAFQTSSYHSSLGTESPIAPLNASAHRCFRSIVFSETRKPQLWIVALNRVQSALYGSPWNFVGGMSRSPIRFQSTSPVRFGRSRTRHSGVRHNSTCAVCPQRNPPRRISPSAWSRTDGSQTWSASTQRRRAGRPHSGAKRSGGGGVAWVFGVSRRSETTLTFAFSAAVNSAPG